MHFKSFLTLLVCSLIFFSCGKEDENPGGVSQETFGSALFTVVNCTDTTADPTCSTTFDVLAASKIYLYTSEENREFNDPIYAEKLTGGEGTAEFINLEGGDYFYTALYPTDATITKEGTFSIANGSRSNKRIEFEEE